MRYKPSKTKAREFAATMREIEEFCAAHGIVQSLSGDSYYFSNGDKHYRVSNHTIEASNAGAYDWMGNQLRELYHVDNDDLICITASKTRIIEIYNDIVNGYALDKRGKRK